jgi:hypothetical protein
MDNVAAAARGRDSWPRAEKAQAAPAGRISRRSLMRSEMSATPTSKCSPRGKSVSASTHRAVSTVKGAPAASVSGTVRGQGSVDTAPR